MSWHFVHEQQAKGPVSAEDLCELRVSGSVLDDTLVWKPGETEWKAFHEFPELSELMHCRPRKKLKATCSSSVDVGPWLASVGDIATRDLFWTAVMRYQYDILDGCEDARDAILRAFIVNCPHMDNDPSTYDLDDDFFMDMVMEVEGKEELWGYIHRERDAVGRLLQSAADIDTEMLFSIEALSILGKLEAALQSGKQEEAVALVTQRASTLGAKDTKGNTPLHLVAAAGAAGVVEALAAAGKLTARLVNTANDAGDTPLHVAVRAGSATLAQHLLQAGARPAVQNKDTSKYADGSWVVKDRASAHAIPLPQMDRTALHLAAEAGDAEMLQLLLGFVPEGAGRRNSLEARSAAGETALQCAVVAGEADAVAALLEAGADVGAALAGDGEGRTALHLAASQGAAGVLKLLLAAGKLDVGQADASGWTPLHLAARRGSQACVQQLLEAGADAAAANAQGRTPLQIAEVNKRGKVVEVLRQHVAAAAAAADAANTAAEAELSGGALHAEPAAETT